MMRAPWLGQVVCTSNPQISPIPAPFALSPSKGRFERANPSTSSGRTGIELFAGDACTLATMIADSDEATSEELDAWVKVIRFSLMSQMLSRYAAETEFAHEKAEQWTKSPEEFIAETGYYVLGQLALHDEELPNEYFDEHLRTIEKSIHGAKNYTRYAMNQAVIAIGVRNPDLTKKALATAARIGKVSVDHGDTACKTPDAAAYIQKTLAHVAEPKSKAARPKK